MASKSGPMSSALRVGIGIFSSRIVGFLRDRAIAHYFGVGPHADVFRTALRGPNVLQNLMGEGTISAAFIPIYSRLIAEGRHRDAGRFAGAIFGLLLAAASALSLLGVLFAEPIVAILAPGFVADASRIASGAIAVDRYALAVTAVRIIFPMTGVLVLSAWALGVLNSHRRFFVPYFAPVLWNVAIIAALWAVAGGLLPLAIEPRLDRLLIGACLGALAGGALQFLVQLPLVAHLLQGFRISLSTKVVGVRDALRAFVPAVAGRGVYQVSAYLDLFLGSLLAAGAVGALGWGQTLYVLPVSLFGMSIAAAELPELSRHGDDTLSGVFGARLATSLRRMAVLTVPTVVGYLAFGFLLVGALYRTGNFTETDNWLVYLVLAGYSLGLLATTWSRLLQNGFYALRDTKTPARVAVWRVIVSAATAVPLMLWLDRFPVPNVPNPDHEGLFLGAVGLALGSAAGAWVELILLRRALRKQLPDFTLPTVPALKMFGCALAAAIPAGALWWWLPTLAPLLGAFVVVGPFGLLYLWLAHWAGLEEVAVWVRRLTRRG